MEEAVMVRCDAVCVRMVEGGTLCFARGSAGNRLCALLH